MASAYVSHAASLEAVKATTPPPLDASLSAPAWQNAVKASAFMNFTALRPASLETIAYFLYDDKNLYVGFHCTQSGVPIAAAQTVDNSGVGSDDHVTVWIDTSANGSRTYSFSATPHGVHSESSSENARYAPPWRSVAQVADGGYNVMMEIPLADLRSQSAPVQSWRINFERYVAGVNNDYTWAFEPAQTSVSSPQYWPQLSGIRIAASATRPKPYADAYALESAGTQRDIFQNGIGQFQPNNPRLAGIDLTYPLTNTLAFVGTLNPDFSNVEQDQTQISPQEFGIVYNEYRPFFAQGAQYINTLPQIGNDGSGISMFYTPSIGIFNRGVKAEGTAGRNAVGVLNVAGAGFDDTAYGYAYTLPDQSFSVSTEGVIATHDGVDDDTVGFGAAQSNPHSGQFTEALFNIESGSLITKERNSPALMFDEGLRNQHFVVQGMYQDIGAEYGPIDGYTAINDLRGPLASVEYSGVGSSHSPVQSYSFTAFGDRYLDRSGNVRQADINAIYNITFKNLISLSGFAGPSELRFYQQGYPYYTGGQTDSYNRRQISIGYKDNTASPTDMSYSWGPFAGFYIQQPSASFSRTFGPYGFSVQYDGNIERTGPGAPIFDSQWLRRVAFSRSFGRDATIGISLRSINGAGGFAQPGTNLSLLYQQRFANQDLLYLEYGTPAAAQTLHRFIVKYVFHAGGGTGT